MTVLQNVSAEEAQTLGDKIRALDVESGMADRAKTLNLGLLLMNMSGPEVLDAAVQSLGEDIKGPPIAEAPTLSRPGESPSQGPHPREPTDDEDVS